MFIRIRHNDHSERVNLFFEDYGQGQPVVLIHGWPLSHRMWEHQVAALVDAGYRVITYDRHGFGDSSKPWNGYDYDTLAEDLHAILTELDLQNAVLVGFSMGGGEVARYLSKRGPKRVSKAVFLSSIAPYMLQTSDNPKGVPATLFNEFKQKIEHDRANFLSDFGKNFVNYDDNKSRVSEEQLHLNWIVATMASPRATLACMDAFGKTDLRKDMAEITIPTLFIHGDVDQVVPIEPTARQGHTIVAGSRLEVITGAPHGCIFTHSEQVNKLLIDFIRT